MELTAQNALQIPAVQTNTGAKFFAQDTLIDQGTVWLDVRGFVTGTALSRNATVDMTAKFQAAMDACASYSMATVYIPAGQYLVNTSATLTPEANTRVVGGGREQCTFYTNHASRAVFTLSAINVELSDCSFQNATANITTSGNCVTVSGSGCQLRNLAFTDIFGGIVASATSDTTLRDITMTITSSFNTPAGSFGVKVTDGVLSRAYNVTINCSATSDYYAVGLWITGANDWAWTSCNIIGCADDLLIAPSSGSVLFQIFTNCYFDQGVNYCVRIQPTSTGVVRNTTFSGCYMAGGASHTPTDCILLSGVSAATSVDGVTIQSCNIATASAYGIRIATLVQNVIISGNTIAACTTSGIGIATAALITNVTVTNNIIGPVGGLGANGLAITLGNFSNDKIIITGNNCLGNSANPSIVNSAGNLPTAMIIWGNIGAGISSSWYTNGDGVTNGYTHRLMMYNSDATGTGAVAGFTANASTGVASFFAHGAGRTATRYGITVADYSELVATAGNGLLIGNSTLAKDIIFGTNSVVVARMTSAGAVLAYVATGGIGYGTGAGGNVNQAGSINTAVTLNTVCGTITMLAAGYSLGNGVAAEFTLNNSAIAATDVVILNVKSGIAAGTNYHLQVLAVAAGSCRINLRNVSGGTDTTSAPVLSFAVIKSVAA